MGYKNHSVIARELNIEFPSCGVKQNPIISLFSVTVKEGTETTVWFKILPKCPWSRPNEKTSFAFTLSVKAIDISEDPENSDVSSANTNVLVTIQNHIFGVKGAGLA